MECPSSFEIKAKLLFSPLRLLLQKYRDRFVTVPSFLVYHQASTILALRDDLTPPFGTMSDWSDCEHNTLHLCRVTTILKGEIQDQIAEERFESL